MAKAPSQEIGKRLRELRADIGKSQAEVGKEVGLSRSAVAQLELGNRTLSAEEALRFARAYRRSPTAILTGAASSPETREEGGAERLVSSLLCAEPSLAAQPGLRGALHRTVALGGFLRELESELGLDIHGAAVNPRVGVEPKSLWEAAHQGFVTADEERRRLDLGAAPIRDLPQTLATLRVRTTRGPLPASVGGLFLGSEETGPFVVVSAAASPEERRFWYAHGLAHAIFDHADGWVVCHREGQERLKEIRANAFASGFLLPRSGVERFLQSMGRDTMGASQGSMLEIGGEALTGTSDVQTVRVSGRARRGAWEMNHFELAQVASYFGVSEALVAHGLHNQRQISTNARDQLIGDESTERGEIARRAMRLGEARSARGREAFLSRLIALAVEMRRRGALSEERLGRWLPLLGLEVEELTELFGMEVGAS